ncbi:MAG: ABC transporter substrate-binding protein, partial [Candidatus Paceibacterota bacterium]
ADDIEFTIAKAQDSTLKSPRRPNWEGVTVEKGGPKEVTLMLKQPYAPFIANTTIGILPKHAWRGFESDQFPFSQYNIEPIGSGPYEIDSVTRSKDGVPTEYTLKAFDRYALGKPFISEFRFSFFSNEKALISALTDDAIESAANISAREAVVLSEKGVSLVRAPLTRVFGVFFNQNQKELLAHKELRKALGDALDKDAIVDKALLGSGTAAKSPLPPTVADKVALSLGDDAQGTTTESILATLKKSKWIRESATSTLTYAPSAKVRTPVSFSLTTSNVPELVETAGMIEASWEELGADIDVKVFEPSDLNQSVIRPRKYDALLFGLVVGRDPDLYAFWHSSQRNDPGLNIAMYTNTKADKALEDMRKATSSEASSGLYDKFAKEIETDTPAIFLYSPDFIYAAPDAVKNLTLGQITTPNDRFLSVYKWYVETDRIWGFVERLRDKTNQND